MKSKPEIDKASTAPTVKALNVKNQATKRGIDMTDSKALTVASTSARPKDDRGAHAQGNLWTNEAG